MAARPDLWGGDFKHALSGPEYAGSTAGREHLWAGLRALDLQVPTVPLPHALDELLSIDHIGVPASWRVLRAEHHSAMWSGSQISDHDAYVVEVEPA